MQTRRWTNPSQPQTLQIAVILLYLNAVFGLLLRSYTPFYETYRWIGTGLANYAALLSFVGMAVSAYGIANERKWGYRLGVALTCAEVRAAADRHRRSHQPAAGREPHHDAVHGGAGRPAAPPDEPGVPAGLVQVARPGASQRRQVGSGRRSGRAGGHEHLVDDLDEAVRGLDVGLDDRRGGRRVGQGDRLVRGDREHVVVQHRERHGRLHDDQPGVAEGVLPSTSNAVVPPPVTAVT